MAYKKFTKRTTKKRTSAGAVKAKQSKPKTTGYVNIKKLAMAVSKVGINKQEKKRYHTYQTDQLLGQFKTVSGAFASGHYVADVTPTPEQGTGVTQMIGHKIRLMSSRFHFQMKQLSNAIGGPMKGTIYIIQPSGKLFDVPQIPEEFLNPNPFLAAQGLLIYDNISNRNFDTMKNYRVHRKIKFTIPADQSISSQVMVKTFSFGIKYNKGNGLGMSLANSIPLTDELKMLIVLDQGLQSTTVGSPIPTGIVTADANTGIKFTYFVDHWFTDN